MATKIEIISKAGKEYFPQLTCVPRVGEYLKTLGFARIYFRVVAVVYENKGFQAKIYVEKANAGETEFLTNLDNCLK